MSRGIWLACRASSAAHHRLASPCRVTFLGEGLLPDAGVRDAHWHPTVERSVFVLTSTELLGFTVGADADLSQYPHTRLAFRKHSARGSLGVSFKFGATRGWEAFTAFIGCEDGSLYALCPVFAPGGIIREADYQQLVAQLEAVAGRQESYDTEALCAHHWLAEVFQPLHEDRADFRIAEASKHAAGFAPADPRNARSILMPAVQGPLRIEPLPPVHGGSGMQTLVDLGVFPADAAGLPALVTLHAGGQVQGVICTAAPMPAWCASVEQGLRSVHLDHVPYRHKCGDSGPAAVLGVWAMPSGAAAGQAPPDAEGVEQIPRLIMDPHVPTFTHIVHSNKVTCLRHHWLEAVAGRVQANGNRATAPLVARVSSVDLSVVSVPGHGSCVPGAAVLPDRAIGHQLLVRPGPLTGAGDETEQLPNLRMLPLDAIYFAQLQQPLDREVPARLGSDGPSVESLPPLAPIVQAVKHAHLAEHADPDHAPDLVTARLSALGKLAEVVQRLRSLVVLPLAKLQILSSQRLGTLVTMTAAHAEEGGQLAEQANRLEDKYTAHLARAKELLARVQRTRMKCVLISRALSQRFSRLSDAEASFIADLHASERALREGVQTSLAQLGRVASNLADGKREHVAHVWGLASGMADQTPTVPTFATPQRAEVTPARGTPRRAGTLPRPMSASPASARRTRYIDSSRAVPAVPDVDPGQLQDLQNSLVKLTQGVARRHKAVLDAIKRMDRLVGEAASFELAAAATRAEEGAQASSPASSSLTPPSAAPAEVTPAAPTLAAPQMGGGAAAPVPVGISVSSPAPATPSVAPHRPEGQLAPEESMPTTAERTPARLTSERVFMTPSGRGSASETPRSARRTTGRRHFSRSRLGQTPSRAVPQW